MYSIIIGKDATLSTTSIGSPGNVGISNNPRPSNIYVHDVLGLLTLSTVTCIIDHENMSYQPVKTIRIFSGEMKYVPSNIATGVLSIVAVICQLFTAVVSNHTGKIIAIKASSVFVPVALVKLKVYELNTPVLLLLQVKLFKLPAHEPAPKPNKNAVTSNQNRRFIKINKK